MTSNTFPDGTDLTGYHFVTISLQPSLYKHKARQQLKKTQLHIMRILSGLSNDFYLVAELTKQCNIHYHACVMWKPSTDFSQDDYKYLYYDIMKNSALFGITKVNELVIAREHSQRTQDYMAKDIKRTNLIVNGKLKPNTINYDVYVRHYVIQDAPAPTAPSIPNKLDKYIDPDSDTFIEVCNNKCYKLCC